MLFARGELLDTGRCPTRDSLVINKVSTKLGSWILLLHLCNQESFKHLGFCTSHSQTATAIISGATTPEDIHHPTLHACTKATVLTEGELTTGGILGTTSL